MTDNKAAEDNLLRQAAQSLYDEYRAGQTFTALPGPYNLTTIPMAYAAQRQYLKLLIADRGPLVGYKLAYTTATMQQQAGWDEPCAGALLSGVVYPSPATLPGADYQRLGMECEVAVQLGEDLPADAAPYTRDTVTAAVAAVMAAIEVIDMRLPSGLDGFTRTLTSVATNISNAGAVLGPPVTRWQDLDLAAARGEARINGAVVGSGYGSDVMGHPFAPLAWLANHLAERGESLRKGAIIITGSIVPPKFLNPGDRAAVTVEGLGSAELSVT